ncbi:MAG: hypothetical protein HFJ57_07505 [Clostridia bacterium]|nr:hypothetical protein [Clostridia bacterium]
MNDKSFVDRIKVDLTDTEEKEALKKIAGIDKELQDKIFKNVRRHDDLIVHIRENVYGDRTIVQAQFKTLGCRMKKAGSCWNCNYGVCDQCLITPGQYVKAFKRELQSIDCDVLVLEALGSITDPKEFDSRVFDEIIRETIENAKTNYILIETHVTQIPEELVEKISTINNGKKQIGFEIGIEDMNPEHRKLINKIGVQNNKLTEVYNILQKHGMSLGINLIYGFPFMSEQERIDSVVDSVKSISRDLPEADIVLFLMSIKENTIMEFMQSEGIYKLPNPWGLVETTREILLDDDIKNVVTFSWFGEKEDPYIQEQTCYTCPACKKLIVDFFKNINGTFNQDERRKLLEQLLIQAENSECRCYEDFKEQLKENDGKNPNIRYREFLRRTIDNERE